MKKSDLKRVIDGMVEESIRRILPNVLNEVLLRTVAQSGVLSEAPSRTSQTSSRTRKKAPERRPVDLRELLDESAGSEFYRDEDEPVQEAPTPRLASRISSLPPQLQQLAEDVDASAFGVGDEWGEGEHDAGSGTPVRLGPPIATVAHAAGVDLSRIKSLIQRSESKAPKKQVLDEGFEQQRIERARARLEVKAT